MLTFFYAHFFSSVMIVYSFFSKISLFFKMYFRFGCYFADCEISLWTFWHDGVAQGAFELLLQKVQQCCRLPAFMAVPKRKSLQQVSYE